MGGMAKRVRQRDEPPCSVDMTPMIDIVFNLIIFFMVVSELSNLALEEIELAYADTASDSRLELPERVLQVNVMPRDGVTKIKGISYTTDARLLAAEILPSLRRYLEIEAAGYEREEPSGASKMRVNIRADKDASFSRVLEIIEACMDTGIYRLSLAAGKNLPAE